MTRDDRANRQPTVEAVPLEEDGCTIRVRLPVGPRQFRELYLTEDEARTIRDRLNRHLNNPTTPEEAAALALMATGDDQLED